MNGPELEGFLVTGTGMKCRIPGCYREVTNRELAGRGCCAPHTAQLLEVFSATKPGVKIVHSKNWGGTVQYGSKCVVCGDMAVREVKHRPNIVKLVRAAAGTAPLAWYRSVWCAPCYNKHLMLGIDLWNSNEVIWKTINEVRIEKGLARITGTRFDQLIVDDVLDHRTVPVDFSKWFK